MWVQKQIILRDRTRGFHLITTEILQHLPEIATIETGLLNIHLLHTSASLTLNENADPTVRQDFEYLFSRLVPENDPNYRHDYEGPDDMPAHIKASLLGTTLQLPIASGHLALGTWQGIYLGEHRNHSHSRHALLTLFGKTYQ